MGADARRAAGRTIEFLRSLAERQYGRVWVPDFLGMTPDVQGFVVFHDGGPVLVTDQSACHVVFLVDVWSGLLEDVTAPQAQAVRDLLDGSLAMCVDSATAGFRDLASYLPARQFAPTEADAWILFACTQD